MVWTVRMYVEHMQRRNEAKMLQEVAEYDGTKVTDSGR